MTNRLMSLLRQLPHATLNDNLLYLDSFSIVNGV